MSEIPVASGASTILELKGASKMYSESPFAGLRKTDLKISKGKVTVVAGESGSGKSTLLKLLAGYMRPDDGRVLIYDEDIIPEENPLIPGHKLVKTVSQDFNLNVYAKVYDNIASLLPNTDIKAKKQKTFELMEFLKIDHLAEKRAVDLSGGEQQRVAIARAIIKDPEVLLLDEPFSQVDAILKTELRADIRRMARYLGITIVLVSHDPLDCLSMADELIILRNGAIVERGDPQQLYRQPHDIYTAKLLANSNVLTSAEALTLGIVSEMSHVLLYPEHIQADESAAATAYKVKEVFFKGFYQELIISTPVGDLVMVSSGSGLSKGGYVTLAFTSYIPLEMSSSAIVDANK